MKKAAKFLLWFIPIGNLFYFTGALVPAVEAKNIAVRLCIAAVSCITAWLFFSEGEFRSGMLGKIRGMWKHPLGKAVLVSWLMLGVSTIFAYSQFAAFFGTVSRGEGFVGITFMYLIAFFMAIFFERTDWSVFWKTAAASGCVAFLASFVKFLGGAYRPGGLMDNPIFLAGYLLFTILAGLMLVREGRTERSSGVSRFGYATIVASVLGILITESRGVMLGLAVGSVVALAYVAFKKPVAMPVAAKNAPKAFPVRTLALRVLIGIFVFGSLFVATRHAALWQKVPGLGRIAQFSTSDLTTQSRLANLKLTLRAVEPRADNVKNMLVGWGWDNYVFAWQAYYDPALYMHEKAIFDRAHNKILDMLVMNGVLGCLAYLAIWFYMFRAMLKIGRRSTYVAAVFIMFGSAFFIQNMFVFDTVISYVPFFAVIAYLFAETKESYEN